MDEYSMELHHKDRRRKKKREKKRTKGETEEQERGRNKGNERLTGLEKLTKKRVIESRRADETDID